jgi:hypothetical protein
MKTELVYIKRELYQQLPEQAWLNSDKTIGVDFAGQKWIVDGSAGIPKATVVTEEPIVEIYGTPMSLVTIRRIARIIMDAKDDPLPFVRHSQCRLPINVVQKMGSWARPSPMQRRSRQ